jgi:hypothetical protein
MLIATFGPSTAWNGKTITFDGSSFVLESHGPVTAAQVLVYESQGHLIWSSEQSAEMVRTMAAAAAPVQQASGTGPPKWRETHRWLGTPRQLIVLAVLFIVLIAAGAGVSQMLAKDAADQADDAYQGAIENLQNAGFSGGITSETQKAQESAVKEGVHSIQIGVQSWAVDHKDAYPYPSDVDQAGLADYLDVWPTNPYTDLPMDHGTGPGQYIYEKPSGSAFRLTAYGEGGAAIITVP